MLAIPKNVFVIKNNNRYFGCIRRSDSIIFAFVSKDDAVHVRANIPSHPVVHKQRNQSYIMKKRIASDIDLLEKPLSQRDTQVFTTDFADFCDRVCLNNVEVSLITSIDNNKNGIILNPTHETEIQMDKDAVVNVLEELYKR